MWKFIILIFGFHDTLKQEFINSFLEIYDPDFLGFHDALKHEFINSWKKCVILILGFHDTVEGLPEIV